MSHSIPLSNIAQVNPPRPPISLDADAEVSFVPMSDVSESGRWDKRQVRRFSDVSQGYTYFAENDVLFAKITPCTENGKGCHAVGVRNGIGFASTEFHVLRANDAGDAGFVYQWSIYSPLRLKAAAVMTGSAGQQRVPASFFDSFEIPRIDKIEQSKIADILSTIDQATEQTETLIAKQQRIMTGLMQDLLTCGIDEQGNLRTEETHKFKDSSAGRIPVDWEPTQIGRLASLQRGHDITEDVLQDGPFPVVSSSGFVGYHTQATSKGPNVVVGRKGTIGKVHYMESDFWAHDTSLYVTDFFGNHERFVFYLFSYLGLARYGTKSGSPSLNRNDIHPLWIGRPSPEEQGEIASRLRECDKYRESLELRLEKVMHLKTGLMQDLLTGEKRVTPLLEVAMTT